MLEEYPSDHQMCILTVKSAVYIGEPGCHMPTHFGPSQILNFYSWQTGGLYDMVSSDGSG